MSNTDTFNEILDRYADALRKPDICQWRFDRMGGVEPTPEQVAFTEALEAEAESDG